MPAASTVKVGCTPTGYRLRVQGQGTMRTSPAVHAFAVQALEPPQAGALVVDLSGCSYLDSTFLGCLVDLHKRYGSSNPPRFTVVVPPGLAAQLFGATQLDRLLVTSETGPESLGAEVELSPESLELPDLGRHLLECHRRLAEIEGPNQAVFRRIADRLAAELETGSSG